MITETSALNIARSIYKLREVNDEDLLEYAGMLNHAIREDLKREICEMLENQHTWLTNVAVIKLIEGINHNHNSPSNIHPSCSTRRSTTSNHKCSQDVC